MKRNNFLIRITIIAAVFFSASCKKDFLDETYTTGRTTEFFKTDAGILQLATGTYYQVFNVPLNGEWIYAATDYGTDEFHVGGDPSNAPWNNYDATFNSTVIGTNTNIASSNFQWDGLYTGIGDANSLIENCLASTSTSAAIKSISLGEGYFMRAYNYLRLVSQYGAVPLQTKPTTTVQLEYTRQSPKEVCAQIISDLINAQ